jgi:hypothetical protein
MDNPPTPIKPPCGSKGQNTAPELEVLAPGAERYNFRVYCEDSRALVAEAYTSEPAWVVTVPGTGLTVGTYSWTCRVNVAGAWTEFFDPCWTFDIYKSHPPADPGTPAPVSPPNGYKGHTRSPELVVNAPAGSDMFHFCVYRGDTRDLVAEAYTQSLHWVVTTAVPELPPGEYSWTCAASIGGEWTDFFQPFWTFAVKKASPPAGVEGEKHPFDPTVQPRTYPNPFHDEIRIRAMVSGSASVTAAVYATDGRHVRTLSSPVRDGQGVEFRWDGRNENGRSVGAGTYLCRITADNEQRVVELTKSR